MPRPATRVAVAALVGAVLLTLSQPAGAVAPNGPALPAEPAHPGPPVDLPDAPASVEPGAPEALALRSDGTGDATTSTDTITWRRCASGRLRRAGARCAMVAVPLDHANPAGPKIRLAVSRVLHSVSPRRYQGVVLVNPGGPGGAGLDFSMIGSALPARVARAYDWIGFDPRGVGASRPALTCDRRYFGFDRPDYVPRRSKDLKAWLTRSRRYAQACAANGDILRFMRTEDSARDVESLRLALGVEQINYYGFSYGTYLGQVYATLFPGRVRRMVLDSNVDPRRVFYRSNLAQDVSMQRAFRLWFRWIARYDRFYQLGRTRAAVEQQYLATRRKLARHPAGGRIGPSEWTDLFLSVAYSRQAWPTAATTMSRYLRTGRAKPLVRAYRQEAGPGRDNTYAVYSAVQCTDAPWPQRWSVWWADNWRVYRKAPIPTWMNAWFNAPCRSWPVPAGPRLRIDATALPGVLLIGGTLDAATPYRDSIAVRRLIPRARLVAVAGESTHAASLDGIPCVTRQLTAYLSRGDLPKRRAGNRADVTCPAPPAPTP